MEFTFTLELVLTMSKKITIGVEELFNKEEFSPKNKKIIINDIDNNNTYNDNQEKVSNCKSIPLYWYFILLIPFLSAIAVIIACIQKKYKFNYQIPSAIICVLVTLFPLFFLLGKSNIKNNNWKQVLAQKSSYGVVIVETEEKGWFFDRSGLGTGVVISKIGNNALILTNRHVVCNKNNKVCSVVTVVNSKGEKLPTKVVALPKKREIDMALLLVKNAYKLDILGPIVDLEKVNIGDEVVAIGHPRGLEFTMTQGIVSAIRNKILIQTSTSINPGNSGGPLINSNGQIIGINTFIYKDSQGLNFAFRADFVLEESQWRYFTPIENFIRNIPYK